MGLKPQNSPQIVVFPLRIGKRSVKVFIERLQSVTEVLYRLLAPLRFVGSFSFLLFDNNEKYFFCSPRLLFLSKKEKER